MRVHRHDVVPYHEFNHDPERVNQLENKIRKFILDDKMQSILKNKIEHLIRKELDDDVYLKRNVLKEKSESIYRLQQIVDEHKLTDFIKSEVLNNIDRFGVNMYFKDDMYPRPGKKPYRKKRRRR